MPKYPTRKQSSVRLSATERREAKQAAAALSKVRGARVYWTALIREGGMRLVRDVLAESRPQVVLPAPEPAVPESRDQAA
jgi:hypothetical protein